MFGEKKHNAVFKIQNFILQVSIILLFSDYSEVAPQLPADGSPCLDVIQIFDLLGFREEFGVGDDVVLHHRLLLHLLVIHPLPTTTRLSLIRSELSEHSAYLV